MSGGVTVEQQYSIGDKVRILETGDEFTVEEHYLIPGQGRRYFSRTENRGAYEDQLELVERNIFWRALGL